MTSVSKKVARTLGSRRLMVWLLANDFGLMVVVEWGRWDWGEGRFEGWWSIDPWSWAWSVRWRLTSSEGHQQGVKGIVLEEEGRWGGLESRKKKKKPLKLDDSHDFDLEEWVIDRFGWWLSFMVRTILRNHWLRLDTLFLLIWTFLPNDDPNWIYHSQVVLVPTRLRWSSDCTRFPIRFRCLGMARYSSFDATD